MEAGKKMVNINLITFKDPKSPESEMYRALRTKVKFLTYQKGLKTIAVTSACAGEGKTTVCANLGIAMAQSGSRVLIIDGNLRNPGLHKVFMMPNIMGFSNLLLKDSHYKDFIVDSGIKNLYLLFVGLKPQNPSEALNFERMRSLLESMKKDFDCILVDTSPVVEVTDGVLLSSVCDGTLLVMALGETSSEKALKARELLTNVSAGLLGIVLNKVKNSRKPSYSIYNSNKLHMSIAEKK